MGEYLFWDGNYADDDRPEGEEPDTSVGEMHEPPPYRGELDWWPIGNDSDNE